MSVLTIHKEQSSTLFVKFITLLEIISSKATAVSHPSVYLCIHESLNVNENRCHSLLTRKVKQKMMHFIGNSTCSVVTCLCCLSVVATLKLLSTVKCVMSVSHKYLEEKPVRGSGFKHISTGFSWIGLAVLACLYLKMPQRNSARCSFKWGHKCCFCHTLYSCKS